MILNNGQYILSLIWYEFFQNKCNIKYCHLKGDLRPEENASSTGFVFVYITMPAVGDISLQVRSTLVSESSYTWNQSHREKHTKVKRV